MECDDGYLKKRWTLYELRCKVAHNAIVNKAEFDRVETLVNELEGKLDDAIEAASSNCSGIGSRSSRRECRKQHEQPHGGFCFCMAVARRTVAEGY